MECLAVGFKPISSKKFWNDTSHRAHTVIPRPPYRWKRSFSGLLQRLRRFSQARYSAECRFLFACPCTVHLLAVASVLKQPQLWQSPDRNSCVEAMRCLPQSQRHDQRGEPLALFSLSRSMITRRPKRWSVKSSNLGMWHLPVLPSSRAFCHAAGVSSLLDDSEFHVI